MKMTSKYILLIFSLLIAISSNAGLKEDLAQAQKKEYSDGALVALKYYKKLLAKYPNCLEANQNAALAAARLVQIQKSTKLSKGFALMSQKYARQAYKLDKNSAQNYYILAVSDGLVALYSSIREKVNSVARIEANAKKCLRLNPKHPYANHLLGKMYYEMSQISSVERKIAEGLVGKLPPGSLEKALSYMKKNYAINPNFIANTSDMALIYHKMKNKTLAQKYINIALKTKSTYPEDKYIKSECRALQKVL